MKEKLYLSWDWIDNSVQKLGEIILDSVTEIDMVTGIPRGGLIPGVYLSHYIGKKYIPYNEAINLPQNLRERILVVDDICDSGITLLEAAGYNFKTSALAFRYSSPYIPDFYSEKITDDRWLVYPWEKNDSKTIQDYLV